MRLAGPIRARVRRREVGVGRGVPQGGVEAVEDPEEPVPPRAQQRIEAHPEGRRERLAREGRRDRVGELRPLDAGREQVQAVRLAGHGPVARSQAELPEAVERDPAVIGQVVQGHQDRCPADDRVILVPRVPEDGRGPGVPVVQVQDVDRYRVGPHRLERRAAEQPEPPRVVGVVSGRVAVEPVAVERGRVVDQAQAIPICGDVDERDDARARRGPWIGDVEDGPTLEGVRVGCRHAAVPGQVHVDRGGDRAGRQAPQGPGERVDDIGQAAGLGPRFALGGEERHSQRHGGHPSRGTTTMRTRAPRTDGKPVHPPSERVSSRHMDPVRVPSIPAASFPLPPRLEGLRRLAYNLYWAWHPRTRGLWSLIDRTAWNRYRNPILVISGSTDWSRLLDDAKFLTEYHDVLGEFDQYMANGSDHWFRRKYGGKLTGPIAYFCAEYGFHESLGIYSGGLGVLAGDHMKAASDMALPALGVGLLYRKGYFRQSIDADGHQEHEYPDFDLARLPLSRVQDENGLPMTVTVELPDRDLVVGVWLAQVGRVPVLLLDTDLPENPDEDRPITHILYVRGREMRLHQELVLGVGGVRAIRALGLAPAAWHLNEGHSAFLLAERARERVATGATLDDAWAAVRRNSVFTIHTPVSAGNERFDADLVRRVAGPLLDRGGVPIERVLELGARHGRRPRPVRHDRVLAAPHQRRQRGQPAPRPHRQRDLAAGSPTTTSWASPTASTAHPGSAQPIAEPARALSRCGPRRPRREHPAGPVLGADGAHPGEASCGTRTCARSASWPISRKAGCAASSPATAKPPSVLAELETALDPAILTIGFARRFATYKRAGLLFTDIDRLARMLWDEERPIQIVFAGKAHPADRPGQQVIQEIFQRSRSPQLRGRVFILEDYDMRVGPLPRPGRRRLAQQPAPTARGVGHVRDEGGPERRPQRQRARRLVGRGLRGRQRLGDRRPRDRTPTRPPRTGPTRRTSTGSWRRRSCPPTTSATRPACRRGWLGVMRRAMATRAVAVLDHPDAPRVHRAAVPAGGRRRGARAGA